MISQYQVLCIQSNIRQIYRDDTAPPNVEAVGQNWDRAAELVSGRMGWFGAPKLIVFPGFFLQGYLPQRSVDDWVKVGIRVPRSKRSHSSPRNTVRSWPPTFGRSTTNGRAVSSTRPSSSIPTAEVILRYRKHFGPVGYTFPADIHDRFVEIYGEKALFPVVDTEIGRLASIICFDVNFPELTRALTFNGAEVFVMPTGEPRGGYREGWEAAKRTRAYENLAYLATSNRANWIDSNLPVDESNGYSEIIDFNGKVMATAETGGECVIRAEIDIEALRRRRANWRSNYLAQLPTDLFARVYEQAKIYPTNHWADKPIEELDEYGQLAEKIMADLYERGNAGASSDDRRHRRDDAVQRALSRRSGLLGGG